MLNRSKKIAFLNRFKSDTDGTMMVTYAVSLMALVASIGVAYDASYYYTGKENAQHTADMLALAATAYLRDNGQPGLDENGNPTYDANGEITTDENFAEGVVYYLDEYDLDITPYVSEEVDENGNKTRRTEFTVDYDSPEDGMLTTTVKAWGQPAIMSAFNIGEFTYSAESVTSYLKEDLKDPASVFFVLDNSGSMDWDEDGDSTNVESEKKLYALKAAVTNFMVKLDNITDGDSDVRFLRTALWAYSSDNKYTEETEAYECEEERWVSTDSNNNSMGMSMGMGSSSGYYETYTTTCYRTNRTYITDGDAIFIDTETAPQWGIISDETIQAMQANGGTDPSGALEHAKNAMTSEESIHYSENEAEDLHKFVIFMTDGDNSSGVTTSSEAQCTAMKSAGVTIYAIGYAISSGSAAETFMQNCASTGKYILAEDADVLNETFDDIGTDILESVIRIQS